MKNNKLKAIKHPMSTEKSIRLMEGENSLIFVVDRKAKKQEIKDAFEQQFKVKIKSVNTVISNKGIKKAYVKFGDETPAIDIATQLGLL